MCTPGLPGCLWEMPRTLPGLLSGAPEARGSRLLAVLGLILVGGWAGCRLLCREVHDVLSLLAEVQEIVRRFSHTTVSNYSILLVAPQLRTLYVGAKDAIFALSLDSIDQHAKMVSMRPQPQGCRACP